MTAETVKKSVNNFGNKAGPGRPPGMPNKTTALLKDAILEAAARAGSETGENTPEGLVAYLQARAIDTPGPFLALVGKVLPMQVVGDPDNPLHTEITMRIITPQKL